MRVIGIGDCVCDIYENMDVMYPGGQALNFSVYAKFLGADSSFMGVFGKDEIANHIISTIDNIGIDHERCLSVNGENGFAVVNIKNGERFFKFSNKGGVLRTNPLNFSNNDLEYISKFDLIHTSNNSYIDNQLYILKNTGVPISYDFSNDWNSYRKLEISKYLDFAFLSCERLKEEEIVNLCKIIRSKGCKTVIATRGKKGIIIFYENNFYTLTIKPIDAVDTLGAGDAFATAFLLKYHLSKIITSEINIINCLSAGANFAKLICMINGAFGFGKKINYGKE